MVGPAAPLSSAPARPHLVIDGPYYNNFIVYYLFILSRTTRKKYSERWRGLYRMFILKKISAQPPSPVPDDAGKKTKASITDNIALIILYNIYTEMFFIELPYM